MAPTILNLADARDPARLRECLDEDDPVQLAALGNLDLLSKTKTAIFCSASCPGSAILTTYDQAARWRDAGRCIISGFHSPGKKNFSGSSCAARRQSLFVPLARCPSGSNRSGNNHWSPGACSSCLALTIPTGALPLNSPVNVTALSPRLPTSITSPTSLPAVTRNASPKKCLVGRRE